MKRKKLRITAVLALVVVLVAIPFAALALLILLATRLDGGGKRAAVIATGVLVTLACWAFLAIGLMAP